MNTILRSSHDVTNEEWEVLRALYLQAFVTMSATLSATDLALMNYNPKEFWASVFDRDKTQFNNKNYILSMIKECERIVAYGLHMHIKKVQYLYIHHFVVHPNYQGQGLGKKLMRTILDQHLDTQKAGLLTRTYNIPAQNFYKGLGFSKSVDVPSIIREYYSHDRVYMELS